MGSGTRFEYAVMGDVVNMSARLSCKARGEVLVTEEVGEQAQEEIEFEERPAAVVSGWIGLARVERKLLSLLARINTDMHAHARD